MCIIDLDTVMPGLSVNDFGDSIRFGAQHRSEDERDLTKVECSMELFELYTKGFVEGCKGRLTEAEMDALPLGAMTMNPMSAVCVSLLIIWRGILISGSIEKDTTWIVPEPSLSW